MYISRSNFPKHLPDKAKQFCFVCKGEGVDTIIENDQKKYKCQKKGCISERFLAWDPKMVQYFNSKDELVHESVGVIVQRKDGKILLFMRTKYPFDWTIPAGHLEVGEDKKQAALRELQEETGVSAKDGKVIFEGELRGESCVGGADVHNWHLYLVHVENDVVITIENEEGSHFMWASIDNLPNKVTKATSMLLSECGVMSK